MIHRRGDGEVCPKIEDEPTGSSERTGALVLVFVIVSTGCRRDLTAWSCWGSIPLMQRPQPPFIPHENRPDRWFFYSEEVRGPAVITGMNGSWVLHKTAENGSSVVFAKVTEFKGSRFVLGAGIVMKCEAKSKDAFVSGYRLDEEAMI